MKHSDWFDDSGLFIGHIPRVIWRPIAVHSQERQLEHLCDCVDLTGFCVDRYKAIRHIRALSAWTIQELKSWSDKTLTAEIFLRVCYAYYENEQFELFDTTHGSQSI